MVTGEHFSNCGRSRKMMSLKSLRKMLFSNLCSDLIIRRENISVCGSKQYSQSDSCALDARQTAHRETL